MKKNKGCVVVFGLLILLLVLVNTITIGERIYERTSPDKQFTVYAKSFIINRFIPAMPGQSGDMPGRIYLYDNVNEKVISSVGTDMLQLCRDAEWEKNDVRFGRGDGLELKLPREIRLNYTVKLSNGLVQIYQPDSILFQEYYLNKKYKKIDLKKTKDSIVETSYESGEIHGRYFYKERNEFNYVYEEFYDNGILKTTFELGLFNGCGIQTGIELVLNRNGALKQKKEFKHNLENVENCHSIKTIVSVTDYRSWGYVKEQRFFKTCYECDESPCGKWIKKDKEGLIVEIVDYGDCD
ncbi:hypothetical protein [Wenyingzhuangia sp. IMCC45574]